MANLICPSCKRVTYNNNKKCNHCNYDLIKKESYSIHLESVKNRIMAVKIIRQLTGLSLAEVTKIVNSVPSNFISNAPYEEVRQAVEKLNLSGNKSFIRPSTVSYNNVFSSQATQDKQPKKIISCPSCGSKQEPIKTGIFKRYNCQQCGHRWK